MEEFKNPQTKDEKLSDWLDTLPENTVINKVLTGCGATTLAIKQKRDTIIAVPFTALIDNKMKDPDIKAVQLGLYGRTEDNF